MLERGDLEGDRRLGARWELEAEPSSYRCQAPPLEGCRDEDDEESHIEEEPAPLQPGQQWVGTEDDRYRALQSDPGDHEELAQVVAPEGDQEDEDCDRTGKQDKARC